MGLNQNIYAGKYLRVWLPTEKLKDRTRVCKKCNTFCAMEYCGECGTKTKPTYSERMIDHCEIIEDIFENEDQFFTHRLSLSHDYEIVLPNSGNQPGCVQIGDEETQETPFPTEELSGDWIVLMEGYDKRNIKYEKSSGIVVFWY